VCSFWPGAAAIWQPTSENDPGIPIEEAASGLAVEGRQ